MIDFPVMVLTLDRLVAFYQQRFRLCFSRPCRFLICCFIPDSSSLLIDRMRTMWNLCMSWSSLLMLRKALPRSTRERRFASPGGETLSARFHMQSLLYGPRKKCLSYMPGSRLGGSVGFRRCRLTTPMCSRDRGSHHPEWTALILLQLWSGPGVTSSGNPQSSLQRLSGGSARLPFSG